MKDTEVIRILNDLAKVAMGDLKNKICNHIDAILDRMEEEKMQDPQDTEQSARKPEQSVQSPPQNAQKAEETPGKTSGIPLLREKDAIKGKPPGGVKKKFDIGKLRALREGNWTVKAIAEEMGCSEATVYNYMKKEGIK